MIRGANPIRVNKIGNTTIIGQSRRRSFTPGSGTSYIPPVSPWGVIILAASERVVSIAMQ